MKGFTVDDFVRFKNLEFQMEEAKKKKEIDKIIRDADEVIEKIIQEYFRNNKGEGENE